MTTREYALQRARLLLKRLEREMHRVAELRNADSIHDLRVSIRRFQQCLAVFAQFFPHGHTKKIRRRLRQVMELAGKIRNRDIAAKLHQESGGRSTILLVQWRGEARELHEEMRRLLLRLERRDLVRRWGSRLEL